MCSKMFRNIFFFGLLIGSVFCQNEVPEDIQKTILEFDNFNQSPFPDLAKIENALKQKCNSNGGAEAYEKFGPAKDAMMECIQTHFNFTEIEIEIDYARKYGIMDEVFAKYCGKRQIILDCLNNLTRSIEPCLVEKEKASLQVFKNVTNKMTEFFCYKDGDRVAMFIAEGGFECIENEMEGLQKCANDTLGHRIPSEISVTNLPLFVIDEKVCQDYLNLQKCVVQVLERCKESTPANIIDALFKFVRQITPCKNMNSTSKSARIQRKQQTTDSSNTNVTSLNAGINENKSTKITKLTSKREMSAYEEQMIRLNEKKFEQSMRQSDEAHFLKMEIERDVHTFRKKNEEDLHTLKKRNEEEFHELKMKYEKLLYEKKLAQ